MAAASRGDCSRRPSGSGRGRPGGWSCSPPPGSAPPLPRPARAGPRRSSPTGSRAATGHPVLSRAGDRRTAAADRLRRGGVAEANRPARVDPPLAAQRDLEVQLAEPVAPARPGRGSAPEPRGPAGFDGEARAPQPGRPASRPPATTRAVREPGPPARQRGRGRFGSAVSSTACTNEPKSAPAGRSDIGDTMSAPAIGRRPSAPVGQAFEHLVVERDRLGLTGHSTLVRRTGSAPSTTSAATRCRSRDVKLRTRRPAGNGSERWGRAGAGADSSTTGPPSASHSRKRAKASRSLTFGSHRSGTTDWPALRPRRRRESPPLGSSQEGAHQVTTWLWARVNAT